MPNDNNLDNLHPVCRGRFQGFIRALEKHPTLFVVRLFEGYRPPERQQELFLKGTSQVQAWRSVHQYGFAADFVPCPAGKWTWDWEHWGELHGLAERFGLHAPIKWDKPHIVVAGWKNDLSTWLRDQAFT